MANSLVKQKFLDYTPGHPAIPSYPGQPWLPERTVWEDQIVCSWKTAINDEYILHGFQWVLVGKTYQMIPIVTINATPTAYYYCEEASVPVLIPAQPYIAPTPAQDAVYASVVTDFNLGWNAGARSKAFISADGRMDISAPTSTVGAVVGLNDADIDAGYLNIEFAWYLSSGIARVMESGQQVFNAGAFDADDVLSIERLNSLVYYKKNGTTVYTSAKQSIGAMFVDASLYSGDDAIYNPVLDGYDSAWTTLPALYGSSGNSAIAQSYARLLPLSGSSGVMNSSGGRLAPLTGMASNRAYGESAASFEALQVFASAGMLMPSYAICDSVLSYLTTACYGYTGGTGGATVSLRALDSLSSGSSTPTTDVNSIAGDGFAEFSAPTNLVNVLAGFSTVETATSAVQITHGLLFNAGRATIMEAGVSKLALGTYLATDVWKISRVSGQVKYFKNNVLRYTSLTPSTGVIYLSDMGV